MSSKICILKLKNSKISKYLIQSLDTIDSPYKFIHFQKRQRTKKFSERSFPYRCRCTVATARYTGTKPRASPYRAANWRRASFSIPRVYFSPDCDRAFVPGQAITPRPCVPRPGSRTKPAALGFVSSDAARRGACTP